MRPTLLILSLLIASIAKAQTSIPSGNVSGTWTLSGSPYLIQGNILVPDNSTLTIEPGVRVEFQGHYKLFCNGRILALGTNSDKVTFTVPAANIAVGWLGIRYEDTPATNDSSYFKHCIIQYCNANAVPLSDNRGGAFYIKNFSKCVIDNCVIENNYAKDGGGAICGTDASPRIVNNYFINNTTYQGGNGIQMTNSSSIIDNNIMSGAGLYIYNSTMTISNNNISGSKQAAITSFNSNLTISNNIFDNNINNNGAGGGGILAYNSVVRIINNIIRNNSTQFCGGGISLYSTFLITSSVISNNLLYGNSSGSTTGGSGNGGGAIYCAMSSPLIVNNTIYNNVSATLGGGLYCIQNSDPIVQNNIIFNNQVSSGPGNIFLDDNQSDPSFFYNNIQGNIAGINSNGNPYSGSNSDNIDVAPGFVNQAGFNFDLSVTSACIDAGDPMAVTGSNIPSLDIAGRTRIKNSRIDMGAYENQSLVLVPVQLLYFTAQRKDNTSLLQWETGTECREFELQKSLNGNDFNTIQIIPSAVAWNGYRYSFKDAKPAPGKNYYRLKMKDPDGDFTYSNICLITFESRGIDVLVYPNPAASYLFVEGDFKSKMLSVKITDITGKLVVQRLIPNEQRIEISLSKLNAGRYILTIADGKDILSTKFEKAP